MPYTMENDEKFDSYPPHAQEFLKYLSTKNKRKAEHDPSATKIEINADSDCKECGGIGYLGKHVTGEFAGFKIPCDCLRKEAQETVKKEVTERVKQESGEDDVVSASMRGGTSPFIVEEVRKEVDYVLKQMGFFGIAALG